MKKITFESECDRCGLRDNVDAHNPEGWGVFTLLDAVKVGDLKGALTNAFGGGTGDRKDLCPTCAGEVRQWFIDGRLPRPVPAPPAPRESW